MTLLHRLSRNKTVPSPNYLPGRVHSSVVHHLAAAALAEQTAKNAAVPKVPSNFLEPVGREAEDFTTHLKGDAYTVDRTAPLLSGLRLSNFTGLDMPLLGIVQSSDSRTKQAETDGKQSREARKYVLEVSPDSSYAAAFGKPGVMVATGLQLEQMVVAHATGEQGPVPGKDMPIIGYGEGRVFGRKGSEKFGIDVSADGEVIIHDYTDPLSTDSRWGTDVITGRGKMMPALTLGTTQLHDASDRAHPLDVEVPEHLRPLMPPADPYGDTTQWPVVVPHPRHPQD